MPEKTIEKKQRIGNTQGVLMIGVAVVVDFVQGLLTAGIVGLIVSTFISIFAWLMFFLWFKLNSIGMLDSGARLAITIWGGAFVEMIPVINVLPAWTISVAIMLFIVRSEDVIFNKTGKNIQLQKAIKRMT